MDEMSLTDCLLDLGLKEMVVSLPCVCVKSTWEVAWAEEGKLPHVQSTPLNELVAHAKTCSMHLRDALLSEGWQAQPSWVCVLAYGVSA